MTDMLNEIQKLQSNWLKLQENLDHMVFQGYSEKRYICVSITGRFQVMSITIDPAYLQANADNSAVVAQDSAIAFQEAVDQVESFIILQTENESLSFDNTEILSFLEAGSGAQTNPPRRTVEQEAQNALSQDKPDDLKGSPLSPRLSSARPGMNRNPDDS